MLRRTLALVTLTTLAAVAVPVSADAAVIATVRGDTLLVNGDGADDVVVLRLEPGTLSRVQVQAGSSIRSFDRATFSRISVQTAGGTDDIRIDEADGVFTDTEAVTIESGAGNDVVAGGRGAEVIATGDDDDLVLGGGGADRIVLGAGDDTAVQGSNDDSDLFEGQSGNDTLRVSGSDESEEFTVQANGTHALVSRDVGSGRADIIGVERAEMHTGGGPDLVDVGNLSGTELDLVEVDLGVVDGEPDTVFAAGTALPDSLRVAGSGDTVRVVGLAAEVRVQNASPSTDRLVVQGHQGNDTIRSAGSVGSLIGVTLEGNEGLDSISGGSAPEVLRGGPGPDTLRGAQGADRIEGGDDADLVIWSPSVDGNDTAVGGAGGDGLRVPSGSAADAYEIVPDADGVAVRGGGSQISLEEFEDVDLQTGGGADTITVGDLSGTSTESVRLDVDAGDLRSDAISVTGTSAADKIRVVAGSDVHELTGLPWRILLLGAEPGDRLSVDARDGDDTVDASGMSKDRLQPFLHGGAGKDVLIGSSGQDEITGGPGADVALLGAGLDTFRWLAGDGSDIVEGGAGTDFVNMAGTGANERFVVSPIGGRTRLIRDNTDVLDLGDLERLDVLPAGGADTMQVDDLSGTDTDNVHWELAPTRGTTASDQAADSVLVNGTFGNDKVDVTAAGQEVRLTGLAATVVVNRSDPTLDRLHLDTKPGNDLVSVQPSVHQRLLFSQS